MPDTISIQPALATHGADRLPGVHLDSYNLELADEEGFVGDRASKRAFRAIIEKWRKPLRELKQDPFGDEASDKLTRKTLDELLAGGHPDAAGVLHGAIEDFAQELAQVAQRFLKLKPWRASCAWNIQAGARCTAPISPASRGSWRIRSMSTFTFSALRMTEARPIASSPTRPPRNPPPITMAHPRRRGPAEPQEGGRFLQSRRVEVRAVAARGREAQP